MNIRGAGSLVKLASLQVAVRQQEVGRAGDEGESQYEEHGHIEDPHSSLVGFSLDVIIGFLLLPPLLPCPPFLPVPGTGSQGTCPEVVGV